MDRTSLSLWAVVARQWGSRGGTGEDIWDPARRSCHWAFHTGRGLGACRFRSRSDAWLARPVERLTACGGIARGLAGAAGEPFAKVFGRM